MKKILLALVLILTFNLVSCNNDNETDQLNDKVIQLENRIEQLESKDNYAIGNFSGYLDGVEMSHDNFTEYAESDKPLYVATLYIIELEIQRYDGNDEEYYNLLLFLQNYYKNLLKE